MKKTMVLFILIILFYVIIGHVSAEKLIPDEAIRLRVIPNSNDTYDQEVKIKVRDMIQEEMYDLLKDTKGIEEARERIVLNNLGYNVSFGSHYFPEKQYKGVTYDAGMYESLLITLGKGEGNNWWCVLFPPLCLIEAEESTEVEYKSFIAEMIEKFM